MVARFIKVTRMGAMAGKVETVINVNSIAYFNLNEQNQTTITFTGLDKKITVRETMEELQALVNP